MSRVLSPAAMAFRLACAASLLVIASAVPASARAADLVGLRLLSVSKDSATLRVELSEPAIASVSYGEEPGAWKQVSRGSAPALVHDLKMPGLAPDRRWFYQVDVDGTPAGDISTFVSGRSWVTRRATILATAAVPGSSPEDVALAERLFARESDALVLLAGGGDPATLRSLHGRALADRMVLTGADDTGATTSVADVALAWSGDLAAAAAASGSCWKIALGSDLAGADVTLRSGASSGFERKGEALVVTLAGRDSVELAFDSGKLTATLTSAAGSSTETLQRACAVPAPAKPVEHLDASELEEEMSMDGEHHDSECDLP